MKRAFILIISVLLPHFIFSQWILELRSNLDQVDKIEQVSQNLIGEIIQDSTITTYQSGRQVRYQHFSKGKLLWDTRKAYFKDKNVELVLVINGIKGDSSFIYHKYDKQNRIKIWAPYDIENNEIREDGNITNFKYNKKGHVVSQLISNIKNNWRDKINYKMIYPNDSTIIRQNINPIYNRVDFELQYEYHTAGNLVIATSTMYDYQYLDQREGSTYEDGSLFAESDYKIITLDTIKRNGRKMMVKKSISKTKYIYDDRGNWIEAYAIKKDGQEQLVSQRIITYQ